MAGGRKTRLWLRLPSCADDGSSGDPQADTWDVTDASSDQTDQQVEIDTTTDAVATRWAECHGGFQCTRLEVPLDHDDPTGAQIELSLVRLPVTKPEKRIGVLVFDGGITPVSAVDVFLDLYPLVSLVAPELSERFDMLAFDWRGSGDSTPIQCPELLPDEFRRQAIVPADNDDFSFWEGLPGLYEECVALSAPSLLEHLRSEDVARDLDHIRAFLGEETINMLTLSDASWLGAGFSVSAPTAPPALVVAGTHNAWAPYEGAVALRDALGNGSFLLTRDGSSSLSSSHSLCIVRAVPLSCCNQLCHPSPAAVGAEMPTTELTAKPEVTDHAVSDIPK